MPFGATMGFGVTVRFSCVPGEGDGLDGCGGGTVVRRGVEIGHDVVRAGPAGTPGPGTHWPTPSPPVWPHLPAAVRRVDHHVPVDVVRFRLDAEPGKRGTGRHRHLDDGVVRIVLGRVGTRRLGDGCFGSAGARPSTATAMGESEPDTRSMVPLPVPVAELKEKDGAIRASTGRTAMGELTVRGPFHVRVPVVNLPIGALAIFGW